MSKRTETIDCRGVPTAIAVLRIKQALQNLSARAEPMIARLSANAAKSEIAAALRSKARSVRLVSTEIAPPAATAKPRAAAVALAS